VAEPLRVVAVLGYSGRRGDGLHPICALRLRHAERLSRGASAVVLSGWARRPKGRSEAELMLAAWSGPEVPLLCDTTARSTAENAAVAAKALRKLDADEVVVVTSWWHSCGRGCSSEQLCETQASLSGRRRRRERRR